MTSRSFSSAVFTMCLTVPGLAHAVPSAGMQQVATSFATGPLPNSIVTGDFNGDGKLDLATPNYDTNTVTVLLGNGDGTFTPAPGSPCRKFAASRRSSRSRCS